MASAFDIAIVGSGFSAWACACALRETGRSVVVLTRTVAARSVGEYLPPEGVQALARLGLADVLQGDAHRTSAGTLSLWEGDRPLRRDTMMQPGGRAVSLDRLVLDRALRTRAEDAGVQVIEVGQMPDISGQAGAWNLAVPEGNQTPKITAEMLVDATGRAAALSRKVGAKIARDDDLVGVATILENAPAKDSVLRIEAVNAGWCYAVPLSQDRVAAVFLTDAQDLPKSKEDSAALAAAMLAKCSLMGGLVSDIGPDQPFTTVPAWSQWTEPNMGAGWAAIGDAAMAFDPLASAGLTKALLDFEALLARLTGDAQDNAITQQRAQRYADYRRQLAQSYRANTGMAGPFWERRQEGRQKGR